MKKYIHYFRWYLIAFGVLTVIFITILGIRATAYKFLTHNRTNSECLTEQRVFDDADVLTDKQEEKLSKLIAKRERQTGCDIVVVTIDQTLEDYVKGYEAQLGTVRVADFAQVYADNFYDENKFGYNEPYGDGVLLLDNFAKESDGHRYTAFSTCGKAEYAYGDAMIDHMLDNVFEYEDYPYLAYRAYINTFYSDMTGHGRVKAPLSPIMVFLLSIVAAGIFIMVNLSQNKAKDTTTAYTYMNGGNPALKVNEDLFLRKHVTQRRIETSSGSSGSHHSSGGHSHSGGHHTSAGGHSHGGGSRAH